MKATSILVSIGISALLLGLHAESCSGAETANNQKQEVVKKKDVSMSFIIMGDLHYCEDRFYDLAKMEEEKPSDFRQITLTYAPVTKANWADQMSVIADKVNTTKPEAKGIVQLGDISEGLGNIDGAPSRIAQNITKVLGDLNLGCPWLLVKGNHDITGVGDECKVEA